VTRKIRADRKKTLELRTVELELLRPELGSAFLYDRFFMIYASLLVFVAVGFWRAGWRKGLEITGISSVICFIFALTFSTSIWDVPRDLRTGLHAILYFPAYVVKHPAQWLNLLTPTAIVAAAWLLFIALRRLRKKPATEYEDMPDEDTPRGAL
jgi:hypothetical protein